MRGEPLALEEAAGQAGSYPVRLVSLNDGDADTGTWEPGPTSRNARRAAADPTAVAYLGDFNSDASAVSMPILNEAGILQISPSNSYVGLTRREGACCGEPGRYFPSGTRHFVRLTPPDHLQARAMVDYLERRRVRRAFVVDDGELYGGGLAALIRKRLGRGGVVRVGRARLHRRGRNAATIARRVRSSRGDAMVFAGITQNGAVRLWSHVFRRNPRLKLFGVDGVAESAFLTRQIRRRAAKRTRITNPTLVPVAYPPSAHAFFSAFRSRYGHEPYPYAIAGYGRDGYLRFDRVLRTGG